MEQEDDMIVVIVGDDGSVEKKAVKQEPEADDEGSNSESESNARNVDYLLETAEKYGEPLTVNVKQELDPDDPDYYEDSEYLEDESSQSSDEEYLIEKTRKKTTVQQLLDRSKKQPKWISKEQAEDTKRTRLLKPEQRKSYVQELLTEHPELKEDQERLVKTLYEIMMKTKPPPLPTGYCTLDPKTSSYICSVCEYNTDILPVMERHYQHKHGQRYLVCFACGVDFRDPTNLYKHEKRCMALDAVVVLRARALAVGTKGRRRPYMPPRDRTKKYKPKPHTLPLPKKFHCSWCPARFAGKLALDAHENLHRGERPYACDTCNAPYASYTALLRHRTTHSGILYICDHCQREFKTKFTLQAHLETHNERKFQCEECGRRFAQKMARELHVRREHRHLPPPCACQICPKRYPRMSVLKKHMRKAHGMELITRNMFIKSLPKLTDMQLQEAKVIMKSDLKEFPYMVVSPKSAKANSTQSQHKHKKPVQRKTTKKPKVAIESNYQEVFMEENEGNENQENKDSNVEHYEMATVADGDESPNEIIVDITDTDLSSEVLQFVQKLQADALAENRDVKIILMDNGRIVHLVDSEVDAQRLLQELQVNENNLPIEVRSMQDEFITDDIQEHTESQSVDNDTEEENVSEKSRSDTLFASIEMQLESMHSNAETSDAATKMEGHKKTDDNKKTVEIIIEPNNTKDDKKTVEIVIERDNEVKITTRRTRAMVADDKKNKQTVTTSPAKSPDRKKIKTVTASPMQSPEPKNLRTKSADPSSKQSSKGPEAKNKPAMDKTAIKSVVATTIQEQEDSEDSTSTPRRSLRSNKGPSMPKLT